MQHTVYCSCNTETPAFNQLRQKLKPKSPLYEPSLKIRLYDEFNKDTVQKM